MSDPPSPTPTSSAQETQDALREVLGKQAEQRQRQDEAAVQSKSRSRAPEVVVLVLGLVSVWAWISPPSMFQPSPIPPPPPIVQKSGLRMDVYMVAVQILRFQSRTGTLPATVEEAGSDPIPADRFEYAATGGGVFRLTAARGDHVVVYSSDQPLTELVSNAQVVLEGAKP